MNVVTRLSLHEPETVFIGAGVVLLPAVVPGMRRISLSSAVEEK